MADSSRLKILQAQRLQVQARGGETSGGPEFVFGRKGNYRAIALEKAKTAPPGLPLSIVGDGTGFEANHFLVVEAFDDPDVQEAIKQMYAEGWNINSYARFLPATDAALRAVAESNTPFTAAMHRGGDGAHVEVNDFQTTTIKKIAADVKAGTLTPEAGRARMEALFEFMLNTSVNADPNMVTTYWDSDDPRLKAMIGLDPDRPLDSDAKKAVRKKVQGLLIEGYGEIKVIDGKKTVVYDENIEELVARQAALAERLENGAKVLDDGSDVKYILWNQEFAKTGAKVLELDRGSSIIQAGAIAIYAYGVQQSGALDELNLEELDLQTMIRLLGNSSLQASVADGVKNIAIDMGFEVVVSGIATALGVGLLWKAYEIYESLDALTAALEFASRHSDNAVIDNLQGLVSSVKVKLDQWFGAGETPDYLEIATLIMEEFPIAEQTLIRDAILDFAVAAGADYSPENYHNVYTALQTLGGITGGSGQDFNTVIQFALMAKPALVWGDALSRSMFDIERSAEALVTLDRALAGPERFTGYSAILTPTLAFLGTADAAVRTEVLDWMAAIIRTAAGSLAGGAAPDTAAHLGYISIVPASDRDQDGDFETTDVIRAAAALARDYGAGHAGIAQATVALTQALVTRTGLLLDTMNLTAVPESAELTALTARASQLMVLADIWGQTNRSLGQTLAKGVAGIAVALAGKAQEVTVSTVGAAEALIDQAVIIAQELRALQGVDPTQDVRTIATAAARAAGQIGAIATSFDLETVAEAIGIAKRAAALLDDLHAEFSTLPGVGESIAAGAPALQAFAADLARRIGDAVGAFALSADAAGQARAVQAQSALAAALRQSVVVPGGGEAFGTALDAMLDIFGAFPDILPDPYEFSSTNDGRTDRRVVLTVGVDFRGSSLDEEVVGYGASEMLHGMGGDDILYGGGGNDYVYGGSGADFIFGGTGNDWLYGSEGVFEEVIRGTDKSANDKIFGEDGDDELNGFLGDDLLDGGTGRDLLFGGVGNDILKGGAGDDRLYGGAGNDILEGGQGNDRLYLVDAITQQRGADIIRFGKTDGNDTVIGYYITDDPVADVLELGAGISQNDVRVEYARGGP